MRGFSLIVQIVIATALLVLIVLQLMSNYRSLDSGNIESKFELGDSKKLIDHGNDWARIAAVNRILYFYLVVGGSVGTALSTINSSSGNATIIFLSAFAVAITTGLQLNQRADRARAATNIMTIACYYIVAQKQSATGNKVSLTEKQSLFLLKAYALGEAAILGEVKIDEARKELLEESVSEPSTENITSASKTTTKSQIYT